MLLQNGGKYERLNDENASNTLRKKNVWKLSQHIYTRLEWIFCSDTGARFESSNSWQLYRKKVP